MQTPALNLPSLPAAEVEEARIYKDWRRPLSGPLSMADVQRFILFATGNDGGLRTRPVWLRSQGEHTHIPMVAAELLQGDLKHYFAGCTLAYLATECCVPYAYWP